MTITPATHFALVFMGWTVPLAALALALALARPKPARRGASMPLGSLDSPAPRLSASGLREALGRLETRLVTCEGDIDLFASHIMARHPLSVALREAQTSEPFPFYMVAIPDASLVFDLRPIQFDPRSELASLEARILSLAAQPAVATAAPSSSSHRL